MSRTPDLTGKRFGRLQVIERDNQRKNSRDVFWRCMCDCGNEKSVTTGHLTCGTVRSCGCLRKEQAIERIKQAGVLKITHGESRTGLYGVWHCMIQRCENSKNPGYKWYGGKGVKVFDEWHNYANFARWAYLNGYRDIKNIQRSQRLSIDRIDSNSDYCPENCRWITVHENSSRAARAVKKDA